VGELLEACWLKSWQKAPRLFPKIKKCFCAFATRQKAQRLGWANWLILGRLLSTITREFTSFLIFIKKYLDLMKNHKLEIHN
jgi:hypothetical protein